MDNIHKKSGFFQIKRFFIIWLLMLISFVPVRLGYNLVFFGWIDIRKFALLEFMVIPFCQALVFFLVTLPFARKKNRPEENPSPDLD